jgi:hypothetical protein
MSQLLLLLLETIEDEEAGVVMGLPWLQRQLLAAVAARGLAERGRRPEA